MSEEIYDTLVPAGGITYIKWIYGILMRKGCRKKPLPFPLSLQTLVVEFYRENS